MMLLRPYNTKVNRPSGFGWDFGSYPLTINRERRGVFSTTYSPQAAVNSSIWNGRVYYCSRSGSNASDGLTKTTPFRSLWKARKTAEADGTVTGYIIILLGDPATTFATIWDRSNDFNDTTNAGGQGAGVSPTKPFAIIAAGGRHIHGPIVQGLALTNDGSGNNTYSGSRSSVATCVEVERLDALTGFSYRMPKNTTQAATQAAAGSWGQVSTTMYVHLSTGAAPTDSNLIILLQGDSIKTGAVDFYISGVEMWGGVNAGGCLAVADAATRNFGVEDCVLAFPGADGAAARDCLAVDNLTGFGALRNVKGYAATKDIFNVHALTGGPAVLFDNCEGYDAGHAGASPVSTSNQIFTLHEGALAICINPKGAYASGALIRNINASQMLALGGDLAGDRGDTAFSGTVYPTGVEIDDTSKFWGQEVTTRKVLYSYNVTSGAQILLKNPIELGGIRTGAGTIGTY